MTTDSRFALSTHLVHDQVLTRDHLTSIARHGFERVEVVATRTHLDYHDGVVLDRAARWFEESGLHLHALHAPVAQAMRQGRRLDWFSTADADDTVRRAAVADTALALGLARRVPCEYLILHLGLPDPAAPPSASVRSAAARTVEEVVALASPLGVRVALEVLPTALASPDALQVLVEDTLEDLDVGVCLDVGHAHLAGGDVADAIETLSGHIWSTHLHDNRGRRDEHLVPFDGTIDWDAAMMELQKVGYDGTFVLEVAGAPAEEVLRKASRARDRLAQMLVTF